MARWARVALGSAVFLFLAGVGLVLLVTESQAPPQGDGAPAPGAPTVDRGPGFGRGGPAAPRGGFDEIDAALAELVAGQVAFNTPDRMQLGESRTIALVASPTLDAAALTAMVRERVGGIDGVDTEALQIGPLMEASLDGAPAFEVVALTPTRQPVSRAAPTEWRWIVNAGQSGTHALHLTINAVVMVAGEPYPRSVDVLRRDIQVDITAAQRVAVFLTGNWQWILGTIVVPLIAWLWGQRRVKRRRK
jgi:hypothetical protein